MKVLKRSQITEVKVSRLVFHYLEVNGKKYRRIEEQKTNVPFMDCDAEVDEPKVKWSVYVGKNTIQDLPKKEVQKLGLEELFEGLDINAKNGNED